MRKETLDFDRSWKMLLDIFFEPFMAFFFPAAHEISIGTGNLNF